MCRRVPLLRWCHPPQQQPGFFLTFVISAVVLLFCPGGQAQQDGPQGGSQNLAGQTSAPAPKPIQDNSFLVEEAYNQEVGVVQHVNSFTRFWDSKDWSYTFNQEWPTPRAPRHQLSYDISVLHSGGHADSGAGLGDLQLNYRYQLLGDGQSRLAFSPRLSLLVPTGSSRFGRGFGGTGVQANLPLSLVLSERWVTHINVGGTVVPAAQNESGDEAQVTGYTLGQSFVWLAHERFNLLLETVWGGTESVEGPEKTEFSHELFLSPGIRWVHNLRNGLQIVPGVAVPLGVGPSAGETGLILYLSLEHPFAETQPR